MTKAENKPVAVVKAPQEEPQTGCVVCGSYAGKLSETAGHARWHAECEADRPDVIAKVRARA